ncbi:nitric oxide synthase, brain [Trichonephila clavipes]|nr:nitric oxide synthase, brain [Trichonephila clavipes]
MKTAFGDEAMSRARVFEWFRPFKEGRQSVNNDPRSGRPSTSRNEDKIAQMKAVVRSDGRLKVRKIAQECHISVVLQWIPSHSGILRNEQTDKLAKEASTLHPPCLPMPLRNAKRLLRDKLRQKRISTLTDLAVGKPWSCLLDGQRRAQLSVLSRVEGVTCFRIITGHDYLQAHLLKIGLADSPLCSLCNSVPMTGNNLSDCPALLHVLSQDNCGVLLPASATSALYWTARRFISERMLAGVACDVFYVGDDINISDLNATLHSDTTWSPDKVRLADVQEPAEICSGIAKGTNRKVVSCTLKERTILQSEEDSRQTLMIVIATPENDSFKYFPGDHVGIYPINRQDIVDGILKRISTTCPDPDKPFQLQLRKTVQTIEDQSLSMKSVYEWFARFREGRESVSDNPRSERPSTSVSDENIAKVSKLITEDRRLTVHMIGGR